MTHEFHHPIQSLIFLDEDSPIRRMNKDDPSFSGLTENITFYSARKDL